MQARNHHHQSSSYSVNYLPRKASSWSSLRASPLAEKLNLKVHIRPNPTLPTNNNQYCQLGLNLDTRRKRKLTLIEINLFWENSCGPRIYSSYQEFYSFAVMEPIEELLLRSDTADDTIVFLADYISCSIIPKHIDTRSITFNGILTLCGLSKKKLQKTCQQNCLWCFCCHKIGLCRVEWDTLWTNW